MSGAAQGYIGRNPGDSQVTIARQQFTPTGVTTDFTFASGYTAGYVDVYINGAKILVGRDYTATNGSVVGLTSAAQNGDIVEIVAYKAFNVNNVAASNGNFTVGGILTVDDNTTLSGQLEVTGVSTFASNVENVVSAGIVTALGFSGNITGAAATFTGDVSIGGTLTYEDVTNIDSVGIVTARAGVNVSGGQLQVGVAYSVGNAGVATAAGFVGPLTGDVTGNVTGNISGGTVAGSTGTFSSNVYVTDQIVHTGDENTQIRFPAADTFTVETGGSEALRVDSSQRLVLGATASNSVGGFGGAALQVEGLTAATSAMSLIRHSNDTVSPTILMGKSRGTSDAATTIVQDNDVCARIIAYGADGTDTESSLGAIQFDVDGTPGSNDMPGRIVFSTTPDGSATYTERLRIDSTGSLLLNQTQNKILVNTADGSDDGWLNINGGGDASQNRGAGMAFYGNENSGNEGKLWLLAGNSGSSNGEIIMRTAGSDRLWITSTGLVTQKNTWTNTYIGTATTQCGYQVQNLSDTTNTYAALRLTAGSSSPATAQIASVRTGTGQNDLTFQVEASNTAKEALRIESGGRAVFYNPNDMTNPDIGGSYAGVVVNKAGVGNIYAATDTGSDGTASVVLNLSRRNGSYDGPQIVLDRGGWAKASIAGLQGGNTASSAAGHFAIYTHNAGAGTRDERLRITGDNGHCGIGTIDPYAPLTVMASAESAGNNLADHGISLHAPGATDEMVIPITACFESGGVRPRCGIGFISHPTADPVEGYAGEIGFYTRDAADGSGLTSGDERMRIARNGRVGIGTDIPQRLLHVYQADAGSVNADSDADEFVIEGNGYNGMSILGPQDGKSTIYFGNPGTNGQKDGGLIYYHENFTTASSRRNIAFVASGGERLRVNSSNILVGTSTVLAGDFDTIRINNGTDYVGTVIRTSGAGGNSQHDEYCWLYNRMGTDGKIVAFNHAGSEEGNISVSGSTVSYNGGHLSRWSQLVGISTNVKSDRPTIYQGTVMSNLDAMCEWTGEDNQQLNKTKVSDTVGDKDVAGVFWAWDDDDDEYTNDFYIAMTGDMVIRVAASTTVARGDLLESAGDGTAKPQSDDIVRSKTVAKITSTTSTATYGDGSKAYPCVLMAC